MQIARIPFAINRQTDVPPEATMGFPQSLPLLLLLLVLF
jgi:hypothetical protein